jgi:type I restriction enzyme S subunit
MSAAWPLVPLGRIARPILRTVPVVAGQAYRTIGVKWWGEGAYERQTIDGSETAARTLNIVRENDLIINKIWVRHGSTAIASDAVDGCAASGEFPTFELDREHVLPRWLHWLTKTRPFWNSCDQLSQGTSGKNRIRPELFLTIEIPLPPIKEQHRIVARIEELTGKIERGQELRRQIAAEAEALAASSTTALFNRVQRDSYPRAMLGEIAAIRAGVTLGRVLRGSTVRIPYLRVANVQDGHFKLDVIKEVEVLPDEVAKWRIEPGDLLVTEGGDWDKLGRGAVWEGQIADCIHQNHIFRVRVDRRSFNPYFLAALMASPQGKAYFQSAAKRTTNLASINQRQLRAFQVVCLPLPEQQRLVDDLEALQIKITELKTVHARMQAELDALLPSILDRAFRGEL